MTHKQKQLVSLGVTAVIVLGVVFAILYGLSSVRSCEDKGEDYFKELGSWPQLGDGRNAASVVRERCARSQTAFPD